MSQQSSDSSHVINSGSINAGIVAPAFVGRAHELTVLSHALAQPPSVILLEGEAGIGKSRLLHECLAAPTARVLVGTCPPFQESLTLGPVIDALRQHRAGRGLSGLQLSPLVGALRPLFPEWDDDLPEEPQPLDDPKSARHRIFSAFAELVASLKIRTLVVEDVHWADRATLEFLLFLLARRRWSLNIVLSYRPEDVAAGSLLMRLTSRPPAGWAQVRISLPPLDVGGTADLVSSMLGGEPVSEEFAGFLYDRTDGIPLAVEESVRLLSQRDDLTRFNGEWIRRSLDELAVPPTVRDSVLERATRLGVGARRVVDAAAVLAEPAAAALIAEVADVDPADADAALAEAVRGGLLIDDDHGRLRFRHALVCRAIDDALTGVEQARLHRRAGRALERRDPQPVVQLARHFQAAHLVPEWCAYAERAADLAASSGDYTTAVTLIAGPLTTASLPQATSVQLATRLAGAATARREPIDELHHHVIATLRGVLDAEGVTAQEEAAIRYPLGRLLLQAGEFDAAHMELERAVPDLMHDPVEAARAMTYLGYPLQGPWPRSTHRHWLDRAASQAPSVSDPVDRIALDADRASALLSLGDESGWAVAAELPAEVRTDDERCELARGLSNLGYLAVTWGRYAEAETLLSTALDHASRARYVRLRDNARANLTHLDWYTGRWAGLADRVTEFISGGTSDTTGGLEPFLVDGLLHVANGSRRRAEERFQQLLAESPTDSIAVLPLAPAAALAGLRLGAGDTAGALHATADAIMVVATKGIWIWATDLARIRVEALLAAGRADEASDLVSEFGRGIGNVDAPAPRAALIVCQAGVAAAGGDHAAAAGLFAAAAHAWDELPRPYDAWLARERQGRSLLQEGSTSDGTSLLAETFQGLADLGARNDAGRVGAALRELGVEVRREWRRGRRGYGDQLSPRELDVVRLVITGRSNREIAEAISRSPKTVAWQINSAMRKLGVTSRTALAVKAMEAGIAPAGEESADIPGAPRG